MKKQHADSQIHETQALRLMEAALRSPEHRGSRTPPRGCTISSAELLGRWSMTTPEGPLHSVAIVRMLDGEPLTEPWYYTDGNDADGAFEHVRDEAIANGTAKPASAEAR